MQILYVISMIIGISVTEWWAILVAYVLIQVSEIHGLLLVRRIFATARDPADLPTPFVWPAITYEWLSADAIALAI